MRERDELNWDAVQAVAELIAAFGVLASLVYVGNQIRQNTQAVRSARPRLSRTRTLTLTIRGTGDA